MDRYGSMRGAARIRFRVLPAALTWVNRCAASWTNLIGAMIASIIAVDADRALGAALGDERISA